MIMPLYGTSQQRITELAIQMIMHGISGRLGRIVLFFGRFYPHKDDYTGDILGLQNSCSNISLVVFTGSPEDLIG